MYHWLMFPRNGAKPMSGAGSSRTTMRTPRLAFRGAIDPVEIAAGMEPQVAAACATTTWRPRTGTTSHHDTTILQLRRHPRSTNVHRPTTTRGPPSRIRRTETEVCSRGGNMDDFILNPNALCPVSLYTPY